MRWVIGLCLALFVSGVVHAAELTITVPDADAEYWLTFVCRWAHCGPGTLSERVEMARQKMIPTSTLSLTWDDPAIDRVVDADGVSP